MTDGPAKKLTTPRAVIKHAGNDRDDSGEARGCVGLKTATENRNSTLNHDNCPSYVSTSTQAHYNEWLGQTVGKRGMCRNKSLRPRHPP